MPNYDNNNLHGALYVTFDIAFPDNDFTDEQKEGEPNILYLCDILYTVLLHYIIKNDLIHFRYKKIIAAKFCEPNIQWYIWQLNI